MTDTPQNTATATDATAVAPASSEAATNTTAAQQTTQQPAKATEAQKPADAGKPEAKADTKAQEKPAAEAKASDGAPESYDWKLPDGVQVDPSALAVFGSVAKEFGLSNEAANGFLGKLAPAIKESQAKLLQQHVEQWKADSKADPKVGGEKAPIATALIAKAMDAFADKDALDLLQNTGLIHHPAIRRTFLGIGQRMSPDSHVAPDSRGAPTRERKGPIDMVTAGERLYGPQK